MPYLFRFRTDQSAFRVLSLLSFSRGFKMVIMDGTRQEKEKTKRLIAAMAGKEIFTVYDPALLLFQKAAVVHVFMAGPGKQYDSVFAAVFSRKGVDLNVSDRVGPDEYLVSQLFYFLLQFSIYDRQRFADTLVFKDDLLAALVLFAENFFQLVLSSVLQVVLDIADWDVQGSEVYDDLQIKILGNGIMAVPVLADKIRGEEVDLIVVQKALFGNAEHGSQFPRRKIRGRKVFWMIIHNYSF